MDRKQDSKRAEELSQEEKKKCWGIILAGGDGKRLQNFVEQLYGYNRPKQYCIIIGTRSLIRHTRDRAQMLIPPERLMTVVKHNHAKYVSEEIGDQPPETIIELPCNRETSAGILLSILKINHLDPESIVTIFPSDHFIKEETCFMEHVREANVFVNSNPDAIVMLGTKPDRMESGYGWIELGNRIICNSNKAFYRIRRFWEKPDLNQLERLWISGCLWNTFVLVGRSQRFIKYIKQCIPDLFRSFEPIRNTIGSSLEMVMIKRMYRYMPAWDFSKFVLNRIPEQMYAMEITGVYWSDWGEEHRIRNDIDRLNLSLTNPSLSGSNFNTNNNLDNI
jgi:mannose-1-phosphate guanylyltransferase